MPVSKAIFAISLATLSFGQTTPSISVMFNPTLLGRPTRPHVGGVATISVLDSDMNDMEVFLVNADACSGTTLVRYCTDENECGIPGLTLTVHLTLPFFTHLHSLKSILQVTDILLPTAFQITSNGAIVQGAQSRLSNITGTCDFHGVVGSFTEAVCTSWGTEVWQNRTATAAAGETTVTDARKLRGGIVTVTDGAGLLDLATSACSQNATSPASGAEATAVVEIYTVMIPVGAALVAGAGILV